MPKAGVGKTKEWRRPVFNTDGTVDKQRRYNRRSEKDSSRRLTAKDSFGSTLLIALLVRAGVPQPHVL